MRISTLVGRFVIGLIALSFVAAILTPTPDVVPQIALMIMMGVVLGILAFIVSRFKSFGQSPQSIKKLIIVLVCLLSITTGYSAMSFLNDLHRSENRSSASSFEGAAFSFANLFVAYSLGSEGVGVVCSVDSPQRFTSAGPDGPCKVSFADGKSVEFNIIRNQIGWIDQQHKLTFLGHVLNKDDLSLMRSRGDNLKVTISSPDELLAFVKRLKAEQAASTAPPEAAPVTDRSTGS